MYRNTTRALTEKPHTTVTFRVGSTLTRQRLIIWVDLRDRYELPNLYLRRTNSKTGIKTAQKLAVNCNSSGGTVIERIQNPNMTTGAIEVLVQELTVLNEAKLPPSLSKINRWRGRIENRIPVFGYSKESSKRELIFRAKVAMECELFVKPRLLK